MEQRCTCGAILPEGARFCHKCGKPQYEEDIARLAEEEQPRAPAPVFSPAATAPPLAGITFRNSRAMTITAGVAIVAFLSSGPAGMISPLLFVAVLLAAGFFAVGLYKGGSAEPLSSAAGARIGWMTGLWLFLFFILTVAVAGFYLTSSEGNELVKQMKALPQFSQVAVGGRELLNGMLMITAPAFFIVTVFPGLGGLLGARFWTKSKPTL